MLFTQKISNPHQVRSSVYNEFNGNKDQAIRLCETWPINARSALDKAILIQDSLSDGALDIFVLTETRITSDAPSCITNSLAPDGFITTHQHRGSSTDKRGGGIAVIHRQDIKSSKIVHDFSGFGRFPNSILKNTPLSYPHPLQTRQPFFQHWCLSLHLQERWSPPLI